MIKELESMGNNVWSLAGFPTGSYILDVIVDLGSAKKGTYETILVILAQGQQPLPPTQIINKFFFDNGNNTNGNDTNDNKTKPDPNPPCPDGYELVDGKCQPIPCPGDSQLDSNGRICEPLPDPPINKTDPDTPIEEIPDVPEEGDQDTDEREDNESGNDNSDNGNNDESEPDQPEESEGSAGVPPFG